MIEIDPLIEKQAEKLVDSWLDDCTEQEGKKQQQELFSVYLLAAKILVDSFEYAADLVEDMMNTNKKGRVN